MAIRTQNKDVFKDIICFIDVYVMAHKNVGELMISTDRALFHFDTFNDIFCFEFFRYSKISVPDGAPSGTEILRFSRSRYEDATAVNTLLLPVVYPLFIIAFYRASGLLRRGWNCFKSFPTYWANFIVSSNLFAFAPAKRLGSALCRTMHSVFPEYFTTSRTPFKFYGSLVDARTFFRAHFLVGMLFVQKHIPANYTLFNHGGLQNAA